MDKPDRELEVSPIGAVTTNLPLQLTSFIGREREMAETKRLLSAARFVTLTGAGGTGKSRLSLEIASNLLEDYADGAWLVELASLSDPSLVPQAVAAALDVHPSGNRPLADVLTSYLRSKSALVVLDNCEHLIQACAQLAQGLLRGCPNLRILATSREALNVPGEIAFHVPSLALPDPDHHSSLESLAQNESVRLFMDRASGFRPEFVITDANAGAIAQICRRLDGMPLAIELAAARVSVLGVEQIAARLDDRFQLLTGGSRLAAPRHQTLRATIDWSYGLLSESERLLFRRLSAFAGAWTLEGAEGVCAGGGIEASEVLGLLSRLIDKSLVIVEDKSTGVRYRFLETLRQYAREKLEQLGEGDRWLRRHLEYYINLAEEAAPRLRTPEQRRWLDRLDGEYANLRGGLEFALEHGQSGAALRLATALWRFWNLRGNWTEGRQWLTRALEKSSARNIPRARALFALAMLCWFDEDLRGTRIAAEESLAISRELGDKRGLAEALLALGDMHGRSGTIHMDKDKFAQCRADLEESLANWRELGDRWGIAECLTMLGFAHRDLGTPAISRVFLDQSLRLWRELGDQWGIAYTLLGLAYTVKIQGDYREAASYFSESYAAAEQVDERRIMMLSLRNLTYLAEYEHNYDLARTYATSRLRWAQSTGAAHSIIDARADLGQVAYLEGNYRLACSCWEHGLLIAQEANDRFRESRLLASLGHASLAEGDLTRTLGLLSRSLKMDLEANHAIFIARGLAAFGSLAKAAGQDRRAALLFAAAEVMAGTAGRPVWPKMNTNPYERLVVFERDLCERNLDALRTRLGPAAFTKACAEGRTWTREQAVAEALDLTIPKIGSSHQLPPHPAGLTAREVEVLRSLARGMSDQQIANQLVVSKRTVQAHLRSIYPKLGVNTRSAATRAALELKLV